MEYLEFVYYGKGNISHIFDVCRAFYRTEKQDRSLTELFMNYKKKYEELNTLLPFNPDIKIQQAQWKKMAVMGFLTASLWSKILLRRKFCLALRFHLSKKHSAGYST